MTKRLIFLVLLITFYGSVQAQKPTQWRGENSEGKYEAPHLLDRWAESGPEVIWKFEELGDGISSPVFANGKIYCTGMVEKEGILFIFNEDGTLEQKYPYAKEWDVNYPGPHSAPTIVGDFAYLYTGYGQLVCLNLTDGSQIWTKSLSDFDAKNLTFGITESVVVDGDKVYFTPGGETHSMVALNRFNGDLIWSSAAEGESAAYCTPKLISLPSRKLLVTHTAHHIIGVDAGSGKMLWSFPHTNQYSIHPNTPIFQDQALFCFSGYGQGCVRLNLNADGSAVEKAWSTNRMDNQMGGAIIKDGYIYISGHNSRGWFCADWKTGEEKYNSKEIGSGVIIMAGDKFILYTDRGELVLANPNPEKMDIISKTKVIFGSTQHWSHPVVHQGILYLRHGKALIAYKISE